MVIYEAVAEAKSVSEYSIVSPVEHSGDHLAITVPDFSQTTRTSHKHPISLPRVDDDPNTSTTAESSSSHLSIRDSAVRTSPASQLQVAVDKRSSLVNEPASLPAWRRIGTWSLLVLSLSFFGFAVASGVLLWLWTANEDDKNWRRIVEAGWMTRSITLAALALRAASSAQGAVTTAMVAAFYLERQGVRMGHAAEVSMYRFQNPGPVLALWNVTRNSHGSKGFAISIMFIVFALATLLLQFASTILLSDVNSGPFLRSNYTARSPAGSFSIQDYMIANYWTITPTNFATFVEYSETGIEGAELLDTGTTIRGFVPIAAEKDRTSLRSYEGTATLVDMRVLCSRPEIKFRRRSYSLGNGEVNVTTFGQVPQDDLTITVLEGVLNVTHTSADLFKNASMWNFNCTFSVESDSHPSIYICELGDLDEEISAVNSTAYKGDQVGGLLSRLAPLRGLHLQYTEVTGDYYHDWVFENRSNAPAVPIGRTYMVWDVQAGYSSDLQASYRNLGCILGACNFTLSGSGPWLEYNIQNDGTTSGTVRVTVCHDAIYRGLVTAPSVHTNALYLLPTDWNISVFANAEVKLEPRVDFWNLISTADTSSIRKQLGGTPERLSLADRGVLPLSMPDLDRQLDKEAQSEQQNAFSSVDPLRTMPFLWNCISDLNPPGFLRLGFGRKPKLWTDDGTLNFPNFLHQDIFLDTLAETQNPALAFQALLTSVFRSAYYDLLPLFEVFGPRTTRSVTQMQIPTGKLGLTVVLGTLLLHWLLTMAIVTLFALRTRFTDLGNAWTTVLQTSGPIVKDTRSVNVQLEECVPPGYKKAGEAWVVLRKVNGRVHDLPASQDFE